MIMGSYDYREKFKIWIYNMKRRSRNRDMITEKSSKYRAMIKWKDFLER